MNNKTKKIIAKEGLLSLVMLLGVVCLLLSRYYHKLNDKMLEFFNATGQYGWGVQYSINDSNYLIFRRIGLFLIITYLCIIIIRFIIWAIRALKQK